MILTAALAASLTPVAGLADKIGDLAAPLTVREWIRGGPVDIKPGTNIYVVEFWAALSTGCRAAIPRLNALQKKFQDQGVIVVAISDEPPDKVRDFVNTGSVSMEYVVAADDQRKTARSYMVAYGQNGIPYTFVVGKDGQVLWHGYAFQGLDQALTDITAGHYDLAGAMKLDAVRAQTDEYRRLSRLGDPKAAELGRKILAARTNNPVALCDFAYRIVTDVHNTNRDFTLASAALDQSQKLAPANTPQLLMARALLLFETGRQEEGLALGRQAVDLTKDPKEKASAEIYLGIIQGRLEAEKKKKEADSATKP